MIEFLFTRVLSVVDTASFSTANFPDFASCFQASIRRTQDPGGREVGSEENHLFVLMHVASMSIWTPKSNELIVASTLGELRHSGVHVLFGPAKSP